MYLVLVPFKTIKKKPLIYESHRTEYKQTLSKTIHLSIWMLSFKPIMYLVYLISQSCRDIIIISWKAPYPSSNGQNVGRTVRADSTISWMIYFKLLWVINSRENSRFPTSVLCLSPLGLFYLSIRHQSARNPHFKHQLTVGKMDAGSLSKDVELSQT